jgi:hypothetical protein
VLRRFYGFGGAYLLPVPGGVDGFGGFYLLRGFYCYPYGFAAASRRLRGILRLHLLPGFYAAASATIPGGFGVLPGFGVFRSIRRLPATRRLWTASRLLLPYPAASLLLPVPDTCAIPGGFRRLWSVSASTRLLRAILGGFSALDGF